MSKYSRIYGIVARIPRGKVATYAQIARLADLPGHARQVGYALHVLPENSGLPWHRVINSKGEISFSKYSIEYAIQQSLLQSEGVVFTPSAGVPLDVYQWRPRRRVFELDRI